jgi:hypothetical protein
MGLFNWIPGMSSNATKKNNASAMNKKVNGVVNQGFQQTPTAQAGGVAPVNFRYPPDMQQPSDKVMEWATTAGLPTPTSGMRNVAHGGARRTKRNKKQKKQKKQKKTKKAKKAKKAKGKGKSMKQRK